MGLPTLNRFLGFTIEGAALADGRLADLAPTLLDLMKLPKPDEMNGQSLIRR